MGIYVYPNELYHYGKKGMKWGIRRYQNEDGTLTAAGKKRYDRDIREREDKKEAKDTPTNMSADPNRWVKEDLKRSKALADAGSSAASNAKKLIDTVDNARTKDKMDLSKMSDQEMRNQINRAMLERQYNDMFNPKKTSKGREYADRALEVAGSVLAVGSSALGIALAIKELRG